MAAMTTARLDDLPPPVRPRRGLRRLREVPVLPSLITLGNLFCGFLAIAKVADALRLATPGAPFAQVVGLFETAAVLVFFGMLFDALDGRVARMTGQTTPFGAQLDSMADMVAFGTAPAFLGKVLVDWHAQADASRKLLPVHPKLFYAAAAVYVLCAALRLARFNVETGADEEDHREFKGLPSPAAAAVVCSLIALFCTRGGHDGQGHWLLAPQHFDWIVMVMPGVLVVLGLLMVSRVPFPHAMTWMLKKRHSLPFLSGLVVFLIVAAVEWQFAVAVGTLGYLIVGLVIGLWRMLFGRRDDDDDGELVPARPAPSRN